MKTFANRKAQRAAKVRNTVDAAVQLLEKRLLLTAAPFSPGDFVVYQVGSGSGTLSTTGAPVYIDEYTLGGTQEQSFLVGSGSGLDSNPLTASGTATSEGNLSLSSNGQYLLVPGYDAAVGAVVTSSSSVAGEVGRIDSQGNIDTSTTVGNLLAGASGIGQSQNVRGAASADGTNIYVSGSKGAVYTTVDTQYSAGNPGSTAVLISSNLRAVEINNIGSGLQLDDDSASQLGTLGSGLPTTSGQTLTSFPGIVAGTPAQGYGGAYQYAFATLSPTATSPDTLYVADTYNYGVDKYSLESGTWTLTGELGGASGNILAGVTGILVEPVSGGEELIMSTPSGIYSYIDTSGFEGSLPTPTNATAGEIVNPSTVSGFATLATAAGNTAFRGLAFVPQPATVSVYANPVSTAVAAGTNATFTSTAYGVNPTVLWQVNTGSGFVNISSLANYSNYYSGVTSDKLTVLNTTLSNPDESGYQYRAVFSNASSGPVDSNPATLTVNPTPTITSLSPIYGPPAPAPGTSVTITGDNLSGATAVYFGTPGPSTLGTITADSDGSITVTSPSESGGAVNVTVVTSAGGSSAINSNDIFTYATTPTVAGVGSTPAASPASGEDRGGTTVTITGTSFISGSSVTFGGIAATDVVVNSYTSITCVDPAAATSGPNLYPVDGGVDVEVTTPLGTSAANPTTMSNPNGDTFTYTPFTNADAETLGTSGTVANVTLDNDSIVTAILSDPAMSPVNGVSYANWAFLVNDGTGSIDVYGTLPDSYTPTIGDALIVKGTWDPYDSIPEIEPSATGGSITVVSTGNSVAGFGPATDTIATAAAVPQPPSLAGQLVTIDNATLTGLGASEFGTGDLPATGSATISDSSDLTGISLYYYPSSYSAANSNLFGLGVPTAPVTVTGIVDVYDGAAEFIPISELGYPEKFSISSLTNTSSDENANDFTDGFNEVSRGSTITVTVTRNEVVPNNVTPYLDTGTVEYELIPDSAVAGTDYIDTDPSYTGTSNGVITGTLSFANTGAVTTQQFTIHITANPGDSGDKLFTIELTNPTSSNPASSMNPTGYLAAVTGGPSTIVINDPNSQTTFSANSLLENANIGVNGPETASSVLTTSIVTIEANSGANTDESYAVLTFDDSSDPSDILNTGAAFQTIDGIELEAQALPKSYDASGILDVYLVGDTLTGSNPYPVASQPTSAGLNFLTSSTPIPPSTLYGDPIQGLGNQLGNKYLLGTIQYSLNQVPGGYTPFNLTNLDPTGVSMLAAELTSGAPFTIAITPGDTSVAATWEGSTTTTDDGPVLRIDYTSTLPGWLNPSSSAVWINPTQNLAVTGVATIIANPDSPTYSNEPVIFAADGSSSVTTINVPSATGIVPIGLGGLSLTGGASMIVDSISGTQSANHYVLDIASGGTFNIDATSQLNLMSNDAIFLGGSLSAVTASLAAGYNGGSWNGDGIMSSTAAGTSGVQSLGVELNNNGSGGVLYGSFDGQTVTNTAVLVKYTYAGDANLDGVVNGSDYTLIDNGYNAGLSGWRNGDFNYSSSINGNDYLLIDNAFNMQGSPLVEPAGNEPTSPVPAGPLSSVFSTGPSIAVSIPGSTAATASVDDGLFNNDKKSVADELFDDDSSAN